MIFKLATHLLKLATHWMTLAVTRAVEKNKEVAISDRGERRDRPQSIWPEVQPLPFFVPQPISSPNPSVDAADVQEDGASG
jgi:hypothetical protein